MSRANPSGQFSGCVHVLKRYIRASALPCDMTMKAWNAAILGTAIIWAGTIFATAFLLLGTGYFGSLIPILGGGAAGNLIVLAGARSAQG